MRPPAPSLDVIAARNSAAAAAAAAANSTTATATAASAPLGSNMNTTNQADDARDSRSSSSTNSPVPADNEESDFFHVANDSQSSLGVVPNLQDMQVTDQECLPTVAALPSEILISIFSRINSPSELLNCMLTCKRWARNVVEILWHRPTCTSWQKHKSICATLGMERPYFTYTDFVKRLNLATLADKVNDGSVMPLAVCTRVERLTLTNCQGLTDLGLIPLVRSNKHLLALDISGDVNVTEKSIIAIAESCHRLQGLNVSNCKQISNESLIQLAESCRYIKRLKLNDCDQLNDAAVIAFANNCPNILEIDLHQCVNIANEPVTALLSKGHSLREFRLVNCDLIDDGAFLSLPSNRIYEHLRILDLTSCTRLTDRAVERIIDVAPRLRNLILAKCSNITDAAVYAISRLGKNLHFIHLGHCRHITDDAVKRLVQSCNRIRYVDLGCCIHLTDESVIQLARLPKLKRIGLVKCSSITDESMYALAGANRPSQSRRNTTGTTARRHEYHTGSLERVHLSYCTNLTLPSIIKLLNCCPKLTHLSLTGVPAFLRDDLEGFCREAPPDFTEHQRAVFCVFSGQGVTGLRNFLNTHPDFAEYHLHQPSLFAHRRSVQINQDGGQGQAVGVPTAPAPDMDGFDDADGVEDDDMGDGSEIALETENPTTNGVNTVIPPPPPPPPHHPSMPFQLARTLPPFPSHLDASAAGEAHHANRNRSNNNAEVAEESTPGPSTAGQGLFTHQENSGPSTAPMQGHAEEEDEGRQS
ncbi:RNI-like protein [Annulohypoxylon maeteangense]|uniref:RNI-like protein n=1 Tax=Annulohypoxylon maeteangense TaxID=1927788 RepID=UPI00200750E8|nr:RNI-like protein [Annulohypoxylon maeteangense]KAI0884079.1 RNI-like protein [Annulohypoxylon maeteangense]